MMKNRRQVSRPANSASTASSRPNLTRAHAKSSTRLSAGAVTAVLILMAVAFTLYGLSWSTQIRDNHHISEVAAGRTAGDNRAQVRPGGLETKKQAKLAPPKTAREAAIAAVAAATNRMSTPHDAVDAASSFFDNIFVKTEHAQGKWKMWNRLDVMIPAMGAESSNCSWADFRPKHNRKISHAPQICLYPYEDDVYVSGLIAASGRWEECNPLSRLFREWMEQNPHQKEEDMIYMDVGANIGSCVMEMLYSTKVKLIIFEPHPFNLQKLTSTLVAQPMDVRKRVALFPVGVGNETAESLIYMASNNRGNSIVGQAIKDTGDTNQSFVEAKTIYIETLDDIFNTQNVAFTVPLMKMDIQGFECRALDGMQQVLAHVDILKTEAAPLFLEAQGCSVHGMRTRITKQSNFTITSSIRLDIVAKKKKSKRKSSAHRAVPVVKIESQVNVSDNPESLSPPNVAAPPAINDSAVTPVTPVARNSFVNSTNKIGV